ncbi:MAG: hypothetical protein R3E01_35515 [Pirellulaceae bacterium]|nr:hypothetical protein [Planctomycetales bacterium]
MRRYWLAILLCVALANSVGCALPAYSGDPKTRASQLIFTSENLRMFADEWARFWFLDQPDHMTPFVTHGGIL